MRMPRFIAPVVFAVAAAACTSTATTPTGPVAPTSKDPTTPLHAQISPTDDDAGGTAAEVFDRAKAQMDQGKLAHARTLFDRVVAAEKADQKEPSQLLRAASYDAALCAELLGEGKDARDRYRALAELVPDSPDAIDANLRRARLDEDLEDFADLAAASSALLARTDLVAGDRAEALAYQALVLIAHGDLAEAGKDVSSAQRILLPSDDATPAPQNAAAYWFADGELLRAQANAIKLNPPPPDFGVQMEARCQKELDAQDAYLQAMRTEQLAWAVRAGLRFAATYSELHDEVVAIPPPKSAATPEKKALFVGAMHLRYRVLLEKGIGTLERTLALQTSTGVKTAWFDHVRSAKEKLDKELADEKAELAKLPYTEAQLQKALDDLESKSSKPAPPAPTKPTTPTH